MDYVEYLEKMTNIHQSLLEYIDEDREKEDFSDLEDKFTNFKDLMSKIKIQDNKHEFKSFLYLLTKISNNHHRMDNFFNKIDKILELFKDDLLKYFTNSELFNIFKSNKRILLFLFEEKIMNFDEFIAKRIIKDKYIEKKYPQYFQPEIQPFIKEKWFPKFDANDFILSMKLWIEDIKEKVPEDFYELRKIGENEKHICKLIRKDLLDEFIVYINEKNYPLDSPVYLSIYETNNFLLKEKNEKTTLIEYASFFGSIQIFNYLRLKQFSLTSSLWSYVVHGNNAEILQEIEDSQKELSEDEPYEEILKESIKCHHNDITYYILNNYNSTDKKSTNYEMINYFKYYSFIFINNEKIDETIFNYLCKYDYYILVLALLSTKNIDINKKTIMIIKI